MKQSLDKIIFLFIFVKVNVFESRPILDGCLCAKSAPLMVNFPVAPPPLEVPCATHGYKVEIPPPVLTTAKVLYSMDMVVEAPVPVAPPPVCKLDLFTPLIKAALPSPDCEEPAPLPAPCGACEPPPPEPAPLPAALPLSMLKLAPSLAALPVLPDDFSGVAPLKAVAPAPVTYAFISSLPAGPPAPLPAAFSLPLSTLTSPCACGNCPPSKPKCRYVLKGIQSNHIDRGRSKRDLSSTVVALQSQKHIDEIRDYIKSLKSTRVARKAKKSKLVKRDIKGEYDLLQREQSEMDLTIPEIIQYMPETMMPNFKRGKCNIGCKNCVNIANKDLNEQLKKINSGKPIEGTNKKNYPTTEQQKLKDLNENTTQSPNQHFDISPQSAGENYLKRSVIPFQNPNPSYSGLMPPPYISSTMELTKLAQNPGNPIWYQPQPLTDTNVEYVYDRLGHKYKLKNGSFKLVTPEQNDDDQVNISSHVASAENTEKTTFKADDALEPSINNASDQQIMEDAEPSQKMIDSAIQQDPTDANSQPVAIETPTVTVGAPAKHNPSHDPHMDKVIRDIVYKHPDFIDATQHAPDSLTLPEEVTRDETMQFLDKLIRGRLSKWFGAPSEDVPMHSLQDLNRYSRETGTSIKFIPVVTVDKERLEKFRQTKAKETS